MKKIIGIVITVLFVTIFVGMLIWLGKMNESQRKEWEQMMEANKSNYLLYEFKGKIIDIKKEDRLSWI